MNWIVEPARALRGVVEVPSDKSISHRATLLGALATGTTRIHNFLWSADCLATVRCLKGLGIVVEQQGEDQLIVKGRGLRGFDAPQAVLDCGGSGTTMRLLAGILAGQPFTNTLTGNEALRRRPMQRIMDPLRRMGAQIEGQNGLPPLTIQGGNLHGMEYALPVASAQVKSCILLAALYADGPTVVHELASSRDHTERMLAAMGVDIQVRDLTVTVRPLPVAEAVLPPQEITVPGDFSSAAFFLVGAILLPGSELRLVNVGVNGTRTGLLGVLRAMGAEIAWENERLVSGEPVADLVVRHSALRGVEVGGDLVPRMIDEFPILAVAATQAEGRTLVRDAAELRVKESDRIAAIVTELRRLGARIEERPDGFVIEGPTPLRGGRVDSHNDHRLAMSLAIAALCATGPTEIERAECIADSFPGFEAQLASLTQRSA